MAGFFGILKNIGMLADDMVLVVKHTANILGDDIAVISEKTSKFRPNRELPVLWEIAKGSLANKVIILPAMFILQYFIPAIIPIILTMGAVYLSYEGYEKTQELLVKNKNTEDISENKRILKAKNLVKAEKDKIKSAILMDFILSIEVVLIALDAVKNNPLAEQIVIVSFVALLATVGVYGLVTLIVRLDDIGIHFIKRGNVAVGEAFIGIMGKLIKSLSYIGTMAMLLVAGGIFLHSIPSVFNKLLGDFILIDILTIVAEMTISYTIGAVVYVLYGFLKKSKKQVAQKN
jgi:predicted DNA repair protein MutK